MRDNQPFRIWNSEEPVEDEHGVVHFFMATLADIDPFGIHNDPDHSDDGYDADFYKWISSSGRLLLDGFGFSQVTSATLFLIPQQKYGFDDKLVLWPLSHEALKLLIPETRRPEWNWENGILRVMARCCHR